MTTVTTKRTNLVKNPSFETGIANWGVASGTLYQYTFAAGTQWFSFSPGPSGTYGLRLSPDGTSALTYALSVAFPVTAGQYAAMSVAASVASGGFQAGLVFYDASNVSLSVVKSALTGVGDSVYDLIPVTVSGVVPANAVTAKVVVYAYNSTGGYPSTSNLLYLDRVIAVQAGTQAEAENDAATYFDGDSASTMDTSYSPAATLSYSWTGAAGASTSVETLTVPLQNYQVQLPTGATVGAGTAVNLVSINGIRDLADLRTGDQPRAQSDGMHPGLNLLGERTVVIKWEVTLASGGVESALQMLAAAFQNVPDPASVCMTAGDWLRQTAAGVGATKPVSMLQIMLPGRDAPLYLFGRPSKFNVPIDMPYQYGQVQVVTEWVSSEGVIYDGSTQSGSAGLPSPTSGLSWPAAFPWSFGASSGGSFTLDNTGRYPALPFFKVQGPLSYPVITNQNTGAYMALDIVLGASDVLTVDHQSGVLTLNGTANRNNAVRVGSSFFTCAPGSTTFGITSGDAVSVTGSVSGYLLPTYSAV